MQEVTAKVRVTSFIKREASERARSHQHLLTSKVKKKFKKNFRNKSICVTKMGGVTLTVSDFRFGFLVLTFKIRVCVCLCVRYVTELLHYDWTGENNAASGDQAIHNRDLDWLHQSDGENQSFC